MDISGVDLSAVWLPAMSAAMDGLLPERGGLVGTHLSGACLTPLVDPGTHLEDERPTPVGSPVAAIDEGMPLSPTMGADVEVARALLEMGVLPAMVTPIVDPAVGLPLSPATYSVPPVPLMSVGDSLPLEVAAPVGLAVGSPARNEMPLHLVSPPASVASPGLPPSSSASRPGGSHRRGHAFVPDVGRRRGSGSGRVYHLIIIIYLFVINHNFSKVLISILSNFVFHISISNFVYICYTISYK